MILLTCQGLDRGGWAVARLVVSVPASPVDLGLILLDEGNFEVNAGVGRHWSDSACLSTSLSLPRLRRVAVFGHGSELSRGHLIIIRRKW